MTQKLTISTASNRGEFTSLFQTEEQFAVDRNFTQFSYKFYTNFGNDSSLVIGIICYVQQNISKLNQDLLGFYEFDLKGFAKFFDTTPQNLIARHKDPHFLKVNPTQEKTFFTSKIGNALFSLKTKPFNDHYVFRNINNKKTERVEDSLVFFKNLEVTTVQGKTGRNKYLIRFELTDKIEVGVFKLFDRIEKRIITHTEIRKDNLDTLYLYLSGAKNISRYNGFNRYDVIPDLNSGLSPFDFLSVIMQVDNIQRFDRRKDKMTEKIKHLNKITGDPVELCFDPSSTGKSHNQPYFKWTNFEPTTKVQLQTIYDNAFEEYYNINLKRTWRIFHLDISSNDINYKYSFEEWKKLESYDYKLKIDAFIKTFAELKGKKLNYTSEEVIMRFATSKHKTNFQKDKGVGISQEDVDILKLEINAKKMVENVKKRLKST